MKFIKKLLKEKKSKTHVFSISLSNIQAAFIKMEHEAGWNTMDKLFWGYYFLDHNLQRLEEFAERLKKRDYQIVEIRNTEKNNLFLLHIEKHTIHTAKSLFDQCRELANLANENNIEIFDGWDVEKGNLNKGLVQ